MENLLSIHSEICSQLFSKLLFSKIFREYFLISCFHQSFVEYPVYGIGYSSKFFLRFQVYNKYLSIIFRPRMPSEIKPGIVSKIRSEVPSEIPVEICVKTDETRQFFLAYCIFFDNILWVDSDILSSVFFL